MMANPVQDTLARTQDRLSTGWDDWAVTPADLRGIATDLDSLSPSQRNAVVEQLTDEDLQRLAGEIMQTRPLIGGLGASERQELFADLARGLDGDQLGRLAEAFATTGGNSDGFTPIGELAQAVATFSGTDQKLAFLAELAPLTTDSTAFVDTGLGYTNTTYADSQASAVGTVLASMRGQAIAEGLSLLDDRQLQAVINSSVEASSFRSSMGRNTTATHTWDTAGFENIMEAVSSARPIAGSSSVDAAEQKARVFEAAGNALAEIDGTSTIPGGLVVMGKDITMQAVATEMADLLQSDTTGIMTELTYDARLDEGTAMTAFSKVMLNTGGEERLGEIMLQLQMGNDGSQNPVDYLEQQTVLGPGRTINANAGALGYFVGSVYAGAEQISSDIAAQQELVTGMLQSVLTVIDKSGVGGRLTAMSASLARVWVGDAVSAAINDPGASPAQRLEDAALPVNAANDRAVSDAANSAFDDSISKILRNN